MKVHHLNCGTMHPAKGPECVCHVLLLETDNGLVLVDSGFGVDDCADPQGPGRTGPFHHPTRVRVQRSRGQPARPARLPSRGRPPHRAHPPRHRPRRRGGRLPAGAAARHLRGSRRGVHLADPRREGPLRPTAVGEGPRRRRTQPRRRSLARVFGREGTQRDRAGNRARLATRPQPRARLRRGRRGPSLDPALR